MFLEMNLPEAFTLSLKYSDLYWNTLIKEIEVAPEALELLQNANKSKIKICIVSDMTLREQVQKIQKLGIGSLIDYLVTSEEVGFEKPHHSMFEAALKKVNSSPERTIMIGDSLNKDIEGAKALGIKAFRVSSK